MEITIGKKLNAKTLGLNGNEAAVLAVIAKCTYLGSGWYSTDEKMAEEIEFVISRPTVFRAIKELKRRGIVIEKNGALFVVQNEQSSVQNEQNGVQNEQKSVQNEQNGVQNEQKSVQNEQKSVQNEQNRNLPRTPSYKEINKEEKEGETCAQTRDTQPLPQEDLFYCFLSEFWLLVDRRNVANASQREEAAKKAWRDNPDKHQLAYDLVKLKRMTKKNDPAFTIIDAQDMFQSLPPPVNYYGLSLARGVEYYETYYNGEKGLYTAADVAFYKMPPPIKTYNAK